MIIPLGLLLPLSSDVPVSRLITILLAIHVCYFARPSARKHLKPGPGRSKEDDGRKRRWISWLAISVVVLLSYLAIDRYRSYLSSLIDERILAIRSAGLPASAGELDNWYTISPDAPNAADAYTEAFKLLVFKDEWSGLYDHTLSGKHPVQALPQDAHNRLSECLKANQGAIELLHRAQSIEECRYPVDLTQFYIGGGFPHFPKILRASGILVFAATHSAERGDGESASDAVSACLALGNSLRREPTVVSQVIRVNTLNDAFKAVRQVINRCSPPGKALETMRKSLEISRDPDALKRGFIGERAHLNSFFELEADELGIRLWEDPRADQDVMFLRATGLMQLDHLASLELLDAYVELSGRPPRQRVKGAVELDQEWRTLPKRRIITRMVLLSLISVFSLDVEALTRLDIALAALAVERFRLRDGRLPNSLGLLVPDYLPTVPDDPFDEKPIRFLTEGESYRLYSIGKDKCDNGGEAGTDIVLAVKRGE